jgi:ribonuclease T1
MRMFIAHRNRRAAGPSQGAACAPTGGSEAAIAASVGDQPCRAAGPSQGAGRAPSGGSEAAIAASVGVHNLRTFAAGMLLAAAFLVAGAACARATPDALPEVDARALPKEAREVLVQIRAGGPFRYDRDGIVFGNREHLLPAQSRGHYHEYTVPTPGASNRGARRIICGGPKTSPEVCYYTADHYASFARIRE